jgi:hypothetical protein
MYSVSACSDFRAVPASVHWAATKRADHAYRGLTIAAMVVLLVTLVLP